MKSWGQPSASSRVVRIVESSKDFDHPRSNSSRSPDALDMDEILEKICDGTQEIVSPKGSSQYGDKLGKRVSASTCGLAALNFARVAFRLEKEENMQGLELLSELLSPKNCRGGRSPLHGNALMRLSLGNYFDLRLLEEQFSPGD